MTARLAILLASSDPLVSTASARLEALGWLRNQLAGRGFQIAIVGGGANPLADLERNTSSLSEGDSVLVHVDGRLVGSDAVALNRGTTLSLPALTELLAARSPGYASVVLDLAHGEDGDEPRSPADLAAAAAGSLGADGHGYSVLAAVRPLGDASGRLAFTRLAMPPLDDGGPPSTEALLAAMHDRAAETDTGEESARPFVFLRGAPDPTIDGVIAQAAQAGEWSRVVALRLDRAETLASVAQRVQELTGIGRILQGELHDADGAVDVLEQARALDPKRPAVLEALRHAYEASGRAVPIDPAEHAKAFAAQRRAGQTDAALLSAMLLDELGVAEAEQQAIVEQARTAGPVQVLRPLDASAWAALRAPGFDEALSALLAAVHDAAVAARVEELKASRRLQPLDAGARLDAESTVSAVRTLHWAARVLGVDCPDLYAGRAEADEAVRHVPGARPSMALAPGVLSGTPTKQLAFLAGRALTWYRPEYHCMVDYPTLDDLRELVGAALDIAGFDGLSVAPSTEATRHAVERHLDASGRAALDEAAASLVSRGGAVGLDHWIRSAELTAARAGLFLCGELKIAVAGVRSQPPAPGRPSTERVTADLIAYCASRGHAGLRAQFLNLPAAR